MLHVIRYALDAPCIIVYKHTMKDISFIQKTVLVFCALLSFGIFLSIFSFWYSAPERLHYKKGSKEYTFIQLSLAQAAIFVNETPPLGTTLRRVIRIQKRTEQQKCEQTSLYQGDMQQMEAIIEEKQFFGLGKTRYQLSSCAGIKNL